MDVVLKNLAKHAHGLEQLFRKWFRISLHVEGNNLVIKAKDAKRAFAERPTLRIHPRIVLAPGSERSHAANLVAQIPSAIDQYRPPAPDEIRIQRGFGYLSEMEEILSLVTVEHPTNLADASLNALFRPCVKRTVRATSRASPLMLSISRHVCLSSKSLCFQNDMESIRQVYW
jgi:hypothetical protein